MNICFVGKREAASADKKTPKERMICGIMAVFSSLGILLCVDIFQESLLLANTFKAVFLFWCAGAKHPILIIYRSCQ